jgi:hypothetical protein
MFAHTETDYKGQGSAAPGAGTSTVLGIPAQAIEANKYQELEAVAVLNDDDAVEAKSVSFQWVVKDTADGADLTPGEGWIQIGDPVVVDLGTDAQVEAVASAKIHTRQLGDPGDAPEGKFYAACEMTITHADAGVATVTAYGVLAGHGDRFTEQ